MNWGLRWDGIDDGLIAAWEAGRELAQRDTLTAALARVGVLVPLPWKGGLTEPMPAGRKLGTLYYLATWQGLRGDDLDVDTLVGAEWTCTLTGMAVRFQR